MKLWDNTGIQAIRLIGELCATDAFTNKVMEELRELMDVPADDLIELIDRCQEQWDQIKDTMAGFPDGLSDNQKLFVIEADLAEHEVDYDYSGRGMMGETCPCVRLEQFDSFTSSANTSGDQLGLGSVVYARD